MSLLYSTSIEPESLILRLSIYRQLPLAWIVHDFGHQQSCSLSQQTLIKPLHSIHITVLIHASTTDK